MFFKPAILALFTGSLLISGMLLFSAYYAVQILQKWDIRSGSEIQLNLERRTYLVSSLMAYALAFQLCLFLPVYLHRRQPAYLLHRRHVRRGFP